MRKISILCALGMMLCVVSCQKENGLGKSGKGREIKVQLGMDQTTKSADASSEELLFAVPFITGSGEELSLEAYISDIQDDFSAYDTKGAPVTTENLASVYGSFKMTVFKGDDVYTDQSEKTMSDVTVTGSGDGSWSLDGGPYYWPEEDDELIFCSSAPASATGVSNIGWNKGTELTFSYTDTPGGAGNDAKAQKDLIFGINANSRTSHVDGDARYAWINFSHALTAVKFIKGDIDNCTIETVSLKNFKSSGKATGTPSEGSLSFTWSDQTTLKTYTQAFGKNVTGLGANTSLDPTDDESCTFLMIPQALDADASVEIQVKYGTASSQTISVNLGSITADEAGSAANAAKLKDWSTYAGKVITIRVNPTGIDVEVNETFNGTAKSNVGAKNTGGRPEFVRMAVVANWVDEDGYIVRPCDFTTEGTISGYSDTSDKWIKSVEGGLTYYYYYKAINPGAVTQNKLFESYAPATPDITGLHLEMDVLVQGVEYDSNCAKAKAAWGNNIPTMSGIE